MNQVCEIFGRYFEAWWQFAAAETQGLIRDLAEDLPSCIGNSSTPKPTGSAFVKAKIFKGQAFHLNVCRYLSFSDKVHLTEVIIEVANKYFQVLENTPNSNIQETTKRKEEFHQQIIRRNLMLFPQRLQAESVQNLISSLAIQDKKHPFIQSLSHFNDQTNELQHIPKHQISPQLFQELAAINSGIVSIKLSQLTDVTEIELNNTIKAVTSCKSLKKLHLSQISEDIDQIIEIIGNAMIDLEELHIERKNTIIRNPCGKTLDKLPKTLTSLTLIASSINDECLKKIEPLSELKKLSLSYNRAVTMLDFSYFPKNIEILNLKGCARNTNKINLASLSKLVELDLSNNHFNGGDLEIFLPHSIKTMDLSFNFMTDSIFERQKNYENLTHLILDYNPIHGTGISSLPKTIEKLSLKCCDLRENGIKNFQLLPNLIELDISNNPLQEEWLLWLPESLKKLTLNKMNLTDGVFDKLKRLKNLTYLSLSENKLITGKGLSVLTPTIQELHISACSILDEGLTELSLFPNLKHLTIDRNASITSEGISFLPQSVTSLDLKKCISLNDTIFNALHHLTQLTSLNMQGIWNISGKGIHLIPKTVTYLNLANCYLTAKTVAKLQQNPQFHEFIFVPPSQMGFNTLEERMWNN